jgi:hypothetical protein
MTKPDMILWLNDSRGVFIPRDFANSFKERDKYVSGVDIEQWDVLAAGPECEPYWDVWDEVLNNAVITAHDVRYTLYQGGDLWFIPEGMEWSDEKETFIWPDETGLTPEQDIDLEALEGLYNRHGRDGLQAMLTVVFEQKYKKQSLAKLFKQANEEAENKPVLSLGIEWICRKCRRQCKASETECPYCQQAH